MVLRHKEQHRTERIGWLRAAVLGANDGIVSTASLVVGVAAADPSRGSIMVAGVAGLVVGAMSMAAGEYVSVSSQSDTENADLEREKKELSTDGDGELAELTAIYVGRGLEQPLAREVAQQLMAHDALATHARDELGISETMSARPIQAALASAATFGLGAALPLLTAFLTPLNHIPIMVSITSLGFLAVLGGVPMPVVLRSGKPSLASLFGEHSRWRRLRESGHCSESPRKRIKLYHGVAKRLAGSAAKRSTRYAVGGQRLEKGKVYANLAYAKRFPHHSRGDWPSHCAVSRPPADVPG